MSMNRISTKLLSRALLAASACAALAIPFVIGSDRQDTIPAVHADWSDYTATVKSGPFQVDLMLNARLQASQSVTLSSALPSNLAKILELTPDGTFLREGDLVARFDRRPLEEALRSIAADIRDTEAHIQQLAADLVLLRKEGEEKTAQLGYQVELARKDRRQLLEVELPAQESRASRDLRKANAALEAAKNLYEMQSQLLAGGLGSAQEQARARAELREAEADQSIARSALKGLREVTIPAERKHAELQFENRERERRVFATTLAQRITKQRGAIQRSKNALRSLREDQREAELHLTLAELRAPVTGILLHRRVSAGLEKRKPQVGDSLWKGHAFAVIPDMSSMIAKAAVSEREVGSLVLGQAVILTPDAYPQVRLRGEVISIGSLLESERGEARFDVRIELHDRDERLRPGMSGRAAVRTAALDSALRVPVQAVFVEDLTPVGFVLRGRDVARVQLALGASNGSEVVVREGLEAGERVLMVYPDSLR